jgi:hypothetical protein
MPIAAATVTYHVGFFKPEKIVMREPRPEKLL